LETKIEDILKHLFKEDELIEFSYTKKVDIIVCLSCRKLKKMNVRLRSKQRKRSVKKKNESDVVREALKKMKRRKKKRRRSRKKKLKMLRIMDHVSRYVDFLRFI
jgi:hypothetical protein